MAAREYRRLPGTHRHYAIHTAWAGGTHLLAVETIWAGERRRRFYYRDIQGFLIQPTKFRRTMNLISGIGFGLLALLLFALGATDSPRSGAITALLALVPGGAILLVNSLRGPGARLTVVTAVQSHELPSVRRRRQADELLRLLDPELRLAQAGLAAPAVEPPPPAVAPPIFGSGA